MEVIVCKNKCCVEIFDRGVFILFSYKDYGYLKDKSEGEILDMYLNNLLVKEVK